MTHLRLLSLLVCWFFINSCKRDKTRFELLQSDETGISFANTVTEKNDFNIIQNMYMYNGGGVGIADLNNDGLPDIVFTGNKVLSRIYLNNGGLKFTDITSNFKGLSRKRQWISGISVTDINSDGLIDLYFTSTQGSRKPQRKNQLWVNQGIKDGQPYFTEMATEYGIADEGYSVHSVFFDYDLDGDLDLYVLNNIVDARIPSNYRDKIVDGSAINNDRLYENPGNGKFIDVTIKAGIVIEGYGLGIGVGDLNKDGYPDLYISNDFVSNDIIYINQKNGTFKNEAKKLVSYQSMFSMGNDIADINNDGNPDIVTMDMMPETYFRKKTTIGSGPYITYINNAKYGYEAQYVRNMLHVNNGSLDNEMIPFSEVGQLVGVYQTEWSWSPLFADYDNDGDKDLLITNGFPKDLTDRDFTNYKATDGRQKLTQNERIALIPVIKVSNYGYENNGHLSFKDKTKDWGMDIPSFSNGAAFSDLDNDGDLDYVVNNINDPAFIFRNNTVEIGIDSVRYIKLNLVGERQNTMAIGAKVELWANGEYQFTEKFLSRGYISSVDPTIHFGMGSKLIIDSIQITWPNNKRLTKIFKVNTNQLLTLYEKDAVPLIKPKPASVLTANIFEASEVFQYQHEQSDYYDFFKDQRIIPHKFSQIGPCMASGDLNGDGLSELIVGASDVLPTKVFQKQGHQLKEVNYPGLTGLKYCQESDMAIVDIDNDGDNDVISLSGGYDKDLNSEYEHFVFRNDREKFVKIKLPIPAFPASIVRVFDYDKDGDSDFFVGARVMKGKFPYAGNSYLIINDKGKFSEQAIHAYNIGMVTDALWSDLDNDGWTDLIISREWNSVAILRNKAGKELIEEKNDILQDKTGLWSSLASGDFDHDGDDDFILGNLGDNHRYNVSKEFPMGLYGIDIDRNGSIDPLMTAYWRDSTGVMQEFPVNYLDDLGTQSPFFKKKFVRHSDFARTTINQMIKSDTVSGLRRFQVNTTSSYILWNDGKSFRWEKLPLSVQISPIKKVLVKDFDLDGNLDVILAGNDLTYDVSTGYYDANKGITLMGKSNGGFEVLQPAKSGLILTGQVESLIYIDGADPVIIAGINRAPAKVYQIKKQLYPKPTKPTSK